MHPKDWEGGVSAGTEAYLASPPRGEVGQLAQRARRVGSRTNPRDWEKAVEQGPVAKCTPRNNWREFSRVNA